MSKKLAAVAAAAAMALVMLNPAPAAAATNVVLAVPGSAFAGYATPVVVLAKSAPAQFVNADAIAGHDVVSVKRDASGKPWFSAKLTNLGVSEIVVNPATPPGQYEFYCTPHKQVMKGTAIVQ